MLHTSQSMTRRKKRSQFSKSQTPVVVKETLKKKSSTLPGTIAVLIDLGWPPLPSSLPSSVSSDSLSDVRYSMAS